MTTKPPSQKASSNDTSLPFLEPLPPLVPPSPPTFPRFSDLVEEDLLSQQVRPKKRDTGLFAGYLGNPQILIADYQAHPERYGSETHALLEQLMHGSTSVERLSEAELRTLDLATFDFFQAVPPKRERQPGVVRKTASASQRRSRIRKPRMPRAAATELPSFWWLA